MDLGTVKQRLGAGYYASPETFEDDVKLVFTNATTFNPAGNPVSTMAKQVRAFVNRIYVSFAVVLFVVVSLTLPSSIHPAGNPVSTMAKQIRNATIAIPYFVFCLCVVVLLLLLDTYAVQHHVTPIRVAPERVHRTHV
jgi:hypothetical protein